MKSASNWITVTESQFPWEQESLSFIRSQFPQQEPYRAWSNFEFVAGDGSLNEVDLLVFEVVEASMLLVKVLQMLLQTCYKLYEQ